MAKNSRVLVIPDIHAPYHHPDALRFLKCVKLTYRPTRVIQLGDEVDYHALSFHESDPDLDSAGPELEKAQEFLKHLAKLFPRMDLLESNHGSLVYRKAKSAGIPRFMLKSYREQLKAPKDWHWHLDLVIDLPNGQKLYCTHGKSSARGALSKNMSMCAVQGHFHNLFHLTYWDNATGQTNWDAHVGCLADLRSLAMDYGKTNMSRGILGCMIIIDGIPKLLPMGLLPNGRWNGVVP